MIYEIPRPTIHISDNFNDQSFSTPINSFVHIKTIKRKRYQLRADSLIPHLATQAFIFFLQRSEEVYQNLFICPIPSETETWLFIVEKIICVLSFFHFNPINAIRQSRGSKVEYSHDGLKSISVKFRGHLVHFSSSAMPGLSLLSLKQNNKNQRTSYLLSCITHPYLNSCCFRVEIFGHT